MRRKTHFNGRVSMQHKDFMKNAAVMTVTAMILRTIGIFFRIYLSNRIGAEGMGLYQLVFSIYVLASTFASSGICTAVARLVTDACAYGQSKEAKRIVTKSAITSALIGILSAIAVVLAAKPLCVYVIKDMRGILSLKVLGLGLPFMGISSCLRGYFLARRKSLLPSISQVCEQIARIGFITLFLYITDATNIENACFAVILGDGLAEALSCIIMLGGYWWDIRKLPKTNMKASTRQVKGGIMYRLMQIAVPITAGRYLNSALRTIENILVPSKLAQFGGSYTTALSQFGALKGMALPLLFFPSSFLSSLSTLLIPELSEARTLGQRRKVQRAVSKALRITLWISILLGGLFTVFAYDLGNVLYKSEEIGFLLRVLAPLVPIMYLESIVDGMLKGLNQQVNSLWYSVLDSVTRIIMIFCIVPKKGMAGFLFIMVLSNLLTSFLNLNRLLQVTGVRMHWGKWILKPVLAVLVSAMSFVLTDRFLHVYLPSSILRMGIGGMMVAVLYTVLSALLGCVNKEDLRNTQLRRSSGRIDSTLPEYSR